MTKDDLDIAVRCAVKAAFPIALPVAVVQARAGATLAAEGFDKAPTEWQVRASLKRLQEGRVLRFVPHHAGWVHGRNLQPAQPYVPPPRPKLPAGPVSVFDLARAWGLGPNVEFSGGPLGISTTKDGRGPSAGTQG